MIKDQFLYFARYPATEGVRAMLTKGKSDSPGYAELQLALDQIPVKERLPEIRNYVYGQSFEELHQRIDKLFGSFLFVDYGEFNMSGDGRNSFDVGQRIAVTVAFKMPNNSDAGDYMLASDQALRLLTQVHAWLLADADAGNVDWLSRDELDKAEILPFVASELHSIGWTLMMTCVAPDMLGTHDLCRSFARQLR